MGTDYNKIADEYQETKGNVIKKYSEEYTFFEVLGNLQDRTILDLACGDGYYSRMFKQKGANQVTGVDVSEQMIAKAQQAEQETPLGIDYQVMNVTAIGQIGQFDLVTAVFLFGYAASRQQLTSMAQTIYDNLQSGGRLVGVTLHPEMTDCHLNILGQYGSQMRADNNLLDGSTVTITIDTPVGPLEIENYYWRTESYEQCFQQAGFNKVIWHPMQVSPDGLARLGAGYWQPYLEKPALSIIEYCK